MYDKKGKVTTSALLEGRRGDFFIYNQLNKSIVEVH